MTTAAYGVGIGWNIPDEELTPIYARNGEVQSERSYSDGGTSNELLFSQPQFSAFGDDEEFQDVMAQFGVLDAETCKVTWRTRSPILEWKIYNGVAKQPQPGEQGSRSEFFLRDYTITIADLVEVEE